MDLRNHFSHLHYIHVIKKGTVIELMNQSPFGVPARRFRDINDIYDDEDSLRDISLAGRNLRKKSSASVAGCSEAGMRILVCSAGASLWNDPFSDEAACDTSQDDSSADDLTLQQLKEKCKKKGKKRKTPEFDFGNETSPMGKEHSVLQPNDDLSDLILPLSCLMSNIRKNRRVNVVENPDFLSQSQNTVLDFDNSEEANFDKYHSQQIESITENSNLPSTVLQPSCSHNEDDNSDCSFSSLNLLNANRTSEGLPVETADRSQGSKMIYEEHAGYQESLCGCSDCSTTCPRGVLTIHKETRNQEYPEGARRSLQQGCLYDLPVAKLSLQEDDSACVTPVSGVCSYTVSPSLDLASQEHDKSEPLCSTNEIISQDGNDPVNYPCTMKASVEAEIMAVPEVVCESVQQLSLLPRELLEEDVQECTYVTPLPDGCLHALSNSVVHISDEYGNSERHCIENEMDSVGADNLVKSDYLCDRFRVNKENENLSNTDRSCQSFQTGISHLPVSEVNVQEDTSMAASLLDVPLDALTSAVNHTSDNNGPVDMYVDMYNDYHMIPAAQINPVNQQIDDRLVGSPEYDVNIMGECLYMVKNSIEGAKTSNLRDDLTTKSMDDVCQSASSTDSVQTNHTAPYGELPTVTSSSVTETSNSTSTESCGSTDKPFGSESHQWSMSCAPERLISERKASTPMVPTKLWKAMESIDTIDSREELRSLGKLFADNQIKHKKRSKVKRNEIKGSEQVNKSDTSKHSESKRSVSAHEHTHSGIKTPHLPSSIGHDKKKAQRIQSCPEGAIIFSKKQMQDFEALAKKLTSELASMKEIIEERLNHEAGNPDHNNDQVIAVINKASKAEETARKRLSAMNRDCIRFCTIMKTSDNNSKDTANSRTNTQKKERKKITFADEAGGQLCQIRFIESGKVSAPAGV